MASTRSNKNSYKSQHHKPKHKHNRVKIQQDEQEFPSTLNEYSQVFIPWEDMKMNSNEMRPNNIMLQGWIVADVKMGTRLCWKVVEIITEV